MRQHSVDAQYLRGQRINNSCHWLLAQLSVTWCQQGSSQRMCNALDERVRPGSPSGRLLDLLALWPLHCWASYWMHQAGCLQIPSWYPMGNHPLLRNSSIAPRHQGWRECHQKRMVWSQASLKVVNTLNYVIRWNQGKKAFVSNGVA